MREPTLNRLTPTRLLIHAAVFAGLIGCGVAQDAAAPDRPGADPGQTTPAAKAGTKAKAASPEKILFGECPPGKRTEWAAIIDQPVGLHGEWFILGRQTSAQFLGDVAHGLAGAKALDAIPVVWLALRDGWPDGKFVDQDILEVAKALADFKDSNGDPQKSIVRLFLEPWNWSWHGPRDAATYKQWWKRAAALFRANGCEPERVILSVDFFPSGVKPQDVKNWIPDEAQLVGLDLYQLKALTPGTPANKLVQAVVAEAEARKLPIVVLESGIADGATETDGSAFVAALFEFVQQHAVAWMFGSYDWGHVDTLASFGWRNGLLSSNPALLADFKQRLARLKLQPAPLLRGTKGG